MFSWRIKLSDFLSAVAVQGREPKRPKTDLLENMTKQIEAKVKDTIELAQKTVDENWERIHGTLDERLLSKAGAGHQYDIVTFFENDDYEFCLTVERLLKPKLLRYQSNTGVTVESLSGRQFGDKSCYIHITFRW